MARPRSGAAPATRRPAQVQSKDRATSSVASRRAVLKRIKDEGIEHVLFWFTDLEGHLKSFAITPGEMQGALDDGMGFDGSSITGFNRIEESDMVAIPDPETFQIMPRPVDDHGHALGSKVGPDDLRRRQARRHAVRGRPALHPQARPRADEEDGLRHVQRRARARVLPLRGRQGHGDDRRGRLLRDDRAGRGHRGAQRHDRGARVRRDPDRVPPPRGRPVAARDRHALRRRARDGRQDDDLPDRRQGGRRLARLLRDVHAEAALRRERLGHAHAHVAVQGRPEPVLRRARTRTTSRTPRSRSSRACSSMPASCRPCSPSG